MLAGVDCGFDFEEAGVVFAVGEEKDEVAAGAGIDCAELVAAGGVDGVDESGAADGVGAGGVVDGGGERGGVAGPGLDEVRGAIEGGDEGLVGLLVEEMLRVFGGDGLIAEEMRGHGAAGVDEDAGADGEVLLSWKSRMLAGGLLLSSRVRSESWRSLTGRPWASAAWKVRTTSSTATLRRIGRWV